MRGGGKISFLGGLPGLIFVRADKDGDGDFDPLTSASWDGDAFAASTGTINWNTVFGVPAAAKAVLIWANGRDETVNAVFILKALSTTTNPAFIVRTQVANTVIDVQGVVAIAAAGTSYYQFIDEFDVFNIRVVGWYL